MKVFDFHLHPGYDFHQNDTDPDRFVAQLRADGLCGASGSFVNLDMNKKPLEEYGRRIVELNERAWAWQNAFPDFFVPGIHIHPDFPELSMEEMKKHKARGGVLVGEIVYYMMGFRYNHPNLPDLLSYAEELDLTVNVHPSKNMDYNRLLVKDHPHLNLVIAHLGGYGLYEDFIDLMRKNENVCCDLSAYGAEREGMLRDAVNRVGSERILYGTDFPGARPETKQKKYLDFVLSEGLSEKDVENILYGNAARLLRIQ